MTGSSIALNIKQSEMDSEWKLTKCISFRSTARTAPADKDSLQKKKFELTRLENLEADREKKLTELRQQLADSQGKFTTITRQLAALANFWQSVRPFLRCPPGRVL